MARLVSSRFANFPQLNRNLHSAIHDDKYLTFTDDTPRPMNRGYECGYEFQWKECQYDNIHRYTKLSNSGVRPQGIERITFRNCDVVFPCGGNPSIFCVTYCISIAVSAEDNFTKLGSHHFL